MGMAFTAKRDDVLTRKALRWAYTILSASIVLLALPLFGITQSFDSYKNGLILQGLMSAFVMTMFLFARSKKLQDSGLRAVIELARSEQKLANERKRHLEQSRFMDVLTHELKTPVSVIRITSDMASMSATQRERINRSVETISVFIDRCRASLQLDHAQMQPVFTQVNLKKFLLDAASVSLEPQRIILTGDSRIEISTDPQWFGIIIQNLIDNALKYSPLGTLIQIQVLSSSRAKSFDGSVSIEVTNRLEPLAKPDPKKIFQKYYRGIGSLGKSGTGLGLFLAQELVTLLGGKVQCHLHEGSISFLVTLPTTPRSLIEGPIETTSQEGKGGPRRG
jgi:signal transduction histidine kinase